VLFRSEQLRPMSQELVLPKLLSIATAQAGASATKATRADDIEDVRACQRGDREAFDRLAERYQRAVYRLCYRYVNRHEDASDLTQETLLKAYRAIDRFRGDASFSTWIYRIAVNSCLNFRSARRPEPRALSESLTDASPGVDANIEREDEASRVRAAVAKLPERQRATLILKVYQDLTHEEVAGILGTRVGTVKANLFHALRNLRKLLEREP
jgi:RNA polymerase sigma-70 factor, ECF subfamily